MCSLKHEKMSSLSVLKRTQSIGEIKTGGREAKGERPRADDTQSLAII